MQSESEVAISVRGLDIEYQATLERSQTLKSSLRRLGRAKVEKAKIPALQDVSFDVHPGDFLGVIGHNGAGKSTLLRSIAGILPPAKGRIEVYGQVSTLLSVGVGFNGELTGRENIRLGCLANGLRPSQIAEIEDEIADFSGLGDFIDYPIKTYSSGMHGRLAFSVSVSLEPDILLIDEALSAGDATFRDQAWSKIEELMGQARAIVLVSHGLSVVQEMSTKVLWLDHGRVMQIGDPVEVVQAYTDFVAVSTSSSIMDHQ